MAMTPVQSDAFHAMIHTSAMQMRRLDQTLQELVYIYSKNGVGADAGFVDHSTNPAQTKAAAVATIATMTQFMNLLGGAAVTAGDHRGAVFQYTRDVFP